MSSKTGVALRAWCRWLRGLGVPVRVLLSHPERHDHRREGAEYVPAPFRCHLRFISLLASDLYDREVDPGGRTSR